MNKLELIALPLVLSLLVSAGFAVSTSYAQGNQTNATTAGNETEGNQTGNQSGDPLGGIGEAIQGMLGGGGQ
ncbi:MAG: hypothetical protein WBW34_07630 [Nitrososphaeraceae archaeon]